MRLAHWTTAAALVLAACSGGGGEAATIAVGDAWARNSPMSSESGAAYMLVTSSGDDAIIGASVDPSVAATAEIHETTIAADGAASTAAVARIPLPAGETVELRPGGFHVMLIGLSSPLGAGDAITVTLRLESGGTLDVPVPVREDGE
jgi:copper(I)-binding protein